MFQNIGKFLLFIMVKLESENVSLELFALQIQAHFHDCKLTVKWFRFTLPVTLQFQFSWNFVTSCVTDVHMCETSPGRLDCAYHSMYVMYMSRDVNVVKLGNKFNSKMYQNIWSMIHKSYDDGNGKILKFPGQNTVHRVWLGDQTGHWFI